MPHQPTPRRAQKGFSFVDLIIVLALTASAFAIVIGIFAPAITSKRIHHPQLTNSTQLRGIHQGIVTFAQSNNQYYPGIRGDGEIIDATVAGRLQMLIDGDYFTPEYMLAPNETDPAKSVLPNWSTPVTTAHHSYSMLQIDVDEQAPRRMEWQSDRISSEAIVMSDRAIPHPKGGIHSIHTNAANDWRGAVVFNDNRTEFVAHHKAGITTRYGPTTNTTSVNTDDDLFTARGDHDAYLIHTGK